MKHMLLKEKLLRFSSVILLALWSQCVFAQYQMIVYTDDGLSVPFNVNRIDSISYKYFQPDDVNDEDETTVTGNVTDITTYTATITSWANIQDNLSTDLKVGIIYTNIGSPNKNNGTQKVISTSSVGSDAMYTIKLTDLAPSTTYFYRSFVYHSGIWFYGNVKEFTTKVQNEVVVSGDVSKLTCYSAKVSASISIDENTQFSTMTYGICYGTASEPTFNDSKVQANSKDSYGNFVCQLCALAGATTYYYRAYSYVNGYLTYGQIRSFTTKADDVVVTGEIDTESYTVKSALKIGAGAYSTLELGVCYGTNELPTLADQTVTANEVDDENNFTLKLMDIPFGTVYYRAFVKIDGVAHYGEVYSFEGNIITTGKIDDTYCVKSNIMLNQSFYTKDVTYGVRYSNYENLSINWTVSTNEVDDENNFTIVLNDIPFGTVYYRAFVKIDGVVHYGEVYSFEGNSITTSEINDAYSVQSHIYKSFYTKTVTYGVCYGKNENPTINDRIVSTNEVDDENNFTLVLKDIPFGTVYYRAFVKIGVTVHYGALKSFKMKYPVGDVVDLGISVKWATFNVGATKPEEYGDYFAWGETEPKTVYSWSNYKWCKGSENSMTKYCSESNYGTYGCNGFTDDKTTLDLEDDVAHVQWGGNWRMPTMAELDDLRNKCTWTWYNWGNTEFNGVAGYKVTSNIEGYKERFIFLPAAGLNYGNFSEGVGLCGGYWSSSLSSDIPHNALNIEIWYDNHVDVYGAFRNYGRSVRPVCE